MFLGLSRREHSPRMPSKLSNHVVFPPPCTPSPCPSTMVFRLTYASPVGQWPLHSIDVDRLQGVLNRVVTCMATVSNNYNYILQKKLIIIKNQYIGLSSVPLIIDIPVYHHTVDNRYIDYRQNQYIKISIYRISS